MIRQEGYGQIYGDMGGATVGASIYKAARENVTFARMVELQRLNLAKRQLRMQQAQAAANADLSRRRLDLDNTRLELEARRLDLVDKQNEEQRLRTEKAYDAKMQELELRQQQEQKTAEQQEQAARLKQEQQDFENGMAVSKAGGNIMGADGMIADESYNFIKVPGVDSMARVPVAQARGAATTSTTTAQGQTRGAAGPTDNQAYRRVNAVVESDMKAAEKSVAEAKKNLAVMESRLQGMEREAAATDGSKQRELVEQYRSEVEAKRTEIETEESGKYTMAEKYRAALADDSSLAQDVPYAKWRDLPWKEYSGEQRTELYNLLKDETEEGRTLLKSLVDKRDFNPWVAEAWRSAKEKLGDDLAMSPDEWLKKYPYKYVETENPGDNAYKEALKQDGTLLMDVDYNQWTRFRRNASEDEKIFMDGLLKSESRYDRELLSKIVDRRGFDLQAAVDWQNAAAKEGAAARRIDPGVWLSVKWDTVENGQKNLMAALLESNKEVDAKAVGAWLYKETGEQALRAGVPEEPSAQEEQTRGGEQPSVAGRPVAQEPTAAAGAEKRGGKLDNGFLVGTDSVILVVNGQRRSIPRATWDALTDEQREQLKSMINASRKARSKQ